MIERRETTGHPMVLMGDFNNTLADGVLTHLLTNTLRFVSTIDRDAYLAKYCLTDSWHLFEVVLSNESNNESECNKVADKNEVVRATETVEAVEATKSKRLSLNINQATNTSRPPSHYFGGGGSVLDYILLSCEFDASYHDSLYQVSAHDTYDRHLINPIFDRDGESTDHGVVQVTLTLRS